MKRPSLKHDWYWNKTQEELEFIKKDARSARDCAEQLGNQIAVSKYSDQIDDAITVQYHRMLKTIS
jgi:hypothetical protein